MRPVSGTTPLILPKINRLPRFKKLPQSKQKAPAKPVIFKSNTDTRRLPASVVHSRLRGSRSGTPANTPLSRSTSQRKISRHSGIVARLSKSHTPQQPRNGSQSGGIVVLSQKKPKHMFSEWFDTDRFGVRRKRPNTDMGNLSTRESKRPRKESESPRQLCTFPGCSGVSTRECAPFCSRVCRVRDQLKTMKTAVCDATGCERPALMGSQFCSRNCRFSTEGTDDTDPSTSSSIRPPVRTRSSSPTRKITSRYMTCRCEALVRQVSLVHPRPSGLSYIDDKRRMCMRIDHSLD
eukprot:200829_1